MSVITDYLCEKWLEVPRHVGNHFMNFEHSCGTQQEGLRVGASRGDQGYTSISSDMHKLKNTRISGVCGGIGPTKHDCLRSISGCQLVGTANLAFAKSLNHQYQLYEGSFGGDATENFEIVRTWTDLVIPDCRDGVSFRVARKTLELNPRLIWM